MSSSTRPANFSRNSLDVVRLVAASQVMLFHVLERTPDVHAETLKSALSLFPGVPVFFFISGFVISASWSRNSDLRQYAIARLLRIYPPLVATLLLSATLLLLLYDRALLGMHRGELSLWALASLAVPIYNPDFLRGYGTGVMNGALWTIPIELCFYAATPLLLTIGKRTRRPATVLLAVMLLSLPLCVYFHHFFPVRGPRDLLLFKVATISPLSTLLWIWMFCFGALVQQWFTAIGALLVRSFVPLLLATTLVTFVSMRYEVPGLLRALGNHMGLLNFVLVSLTVLSFAYRFPDLSRRLLKGNDLSYGLYVFHMPVLNAYLEAGFRGLECVVATIATSYAVAAASWFFLETPMMELSKRWRSRTRAQPALPVASSAT